MNIHTQSAQRPRIAERGVPVNTFLTWRSSHYRSRARERKRSRGMRVDMQGVLEESVPLVDAHAAAAPTATDRAQHQSRRSSLKATIAVGLACALLVAAAIVLGIDKNHDASIGTRDEGTKSAKKEVEVSTLGGDYYDFESNGGIFSCLPAMSGEYPNAITDSENADGIEHKISPRDCAWYKLLQPFAQQRANVPSTCAPANTLFVSIADSDNYEIAKLSTKRVQNEQCFMDRHIIVTTDAEATRKCEEENLFHCLQYADGHAFDGYQHTGGHAEDKKYSMLTWFKQKVTLGLLAADVDFFLFDTDVILFKVPDLALLAARFPQANLFYQQDWVGYQAWYHGRYPYLYDNSGAIERHEDAWNFNSGQIYWRASPTTLKIQQIALSLGPHPMEQECVMLAINQLSTQGEAHAATLSFDDYGSGCADVNLVPGEPRDFWSPEVLTHMRSWTSLHSDCGLQKSSGMLMMEARLHCLSTYNDPVLCVGITTPEDWERMKEETGAALGNEEAAHKKLTKLQLRKSKVATLLARFECTIANGGEGVRETPPSR